MFSDPQQWQHGPTEQNPADLISRENLKHNSLWWNGQQWLLEDKTAGQELVLMTHRPK